MRGFFRGRYDYEYSPVLVKKYELFRYAGESFVVGSFLKSRYPGNMTFCNFRLGDSDTFNYTDEDISFSPELGDKSPYRVLYSVVRGFQFNTSETDSVTYVTHTTLEFLFHIVEIVRRWGGPVSVACFLPGTDTTLALKVLEKMCFCLKEMENVNIHFVYPQHHPPRQMSLKNYSVWLDMEDIAYAPWQIVETDFFLQNSSVSLPDGKSNKTTPKGLSSAQASSNGNTGNCYVPDKILNDSYRKRNNLVYPINVARNVARYGARSKFLLVSDIELFPSDNLVEEFLKMIQRLKEKNKSLGDHYFTKKKHVFVLPVFEVAENEPDVPRTKAQLLDLYEKERAVYFHRYICIHCQRFPGIQRWLQRKVHPRIKPGTIQPMLVVKREFPYHRWEPIYIGTNEEPLYSELLTWEGQQDKMTQMHEMCLLEYRFVILNGAFLVHVPGIKRRPRKITQLKTGNQITSSRPGSNNTIISSGRLTETTNSEDSWKNSHIKRNSYLYQIITQDEPPPHSLELENPSSQTS
ncbi:hypothetical protein RUM43_012495 [Polyplax serrata]|uniref:Uncharacterized protein n=1 Tax=Polyplax serrata TaxID=468196 RepID=A0AAN8RZF6_POLSC